MLKQYQLFDVIIVCRVEWLETSLFIVNKKSVGNIANGKENNEKNMHRDTIAFSCTSIHLQFPPCSNYLLTQLLFIFLMDLSLLSISALHFRYPSSFHLLCDIYYLAQTQKRKGEKKWKPASPFVH